MTPEDVADEMVVAIAEVLALGWRFNNCYQTHGDLWRISLRRPTPGGDWHTDWAEGETFAEAIADCMSKLNDAVFVEDTEVKGYAEPAPIHVPLAERLGLNRSPANANFNPRRL